MTQTPVRNLFFASPQFAQPYLVDGALDIPTYHAALKAATPIIPPQTALHRFAEWGLRKMKDLAPQALIVFFVVGFVFVCAAINGVFGSEPNPIYTLLFFVPFILVEVLQKVLERMRDPYLPHQRAHARCVHEGVIIEGEVVNWEIDIHPNRLSGSHTMIDDYHTLYAHLLVSYRFTPPGQAERTGRVTTQSEQYALVYGTSTYAEKERALRETWQAFSQRYPAGTPLYVLYLAGTPPQVL